MIQASTFQSEGANVPEYIHNRVCLSEEVLQNPPLQKGATNS